MNATVWVTTAFPGWHFWPDAPQERSYLRQAHRHLFHVRVEVLVEHDDRDVEYHDLLDLLHEHLPGPHLGAQSCEMIARDLATRIQKDLPGRGVRVSVSEDGEAGSTVTLPA